MRDLLTAGLATQKVLLDMQAGQIRLFEDMLKAVPTLARTPVQQRVQATLDDVVAAQGKLARTWMGLGAVSR
jgi:hypothetical protein